MNEEMRRHALAYVEESLGISRFLVANKSDAEIQAFVSQLHGSWESFVSDLMAKSEEFDFETATEFQRRAYIESIICKKYTWGHSEIVRWNISDDKIVVLCKVQQIREGNYRDTVKQVGDRILVWNLVSPGVWEMDSPLTAWSDGCGEFVKRGRVHTSDYVAEQEWQWEYCYRPGTSRSPMDGPRRRDLPDNAWTEPDEEDADYRTVYVSEASYGADIKGWK